MCWRRSDNVDARTLGVRKTSKKHIECWKHVNTTHGMTTIVKEETIMVMQEFKMLDLDL